MRAAVPVLALAALAGCGRAPPAADGEARAAARVVARYYALLESGRTEEAARLRGDRVREDLRPLRTLNADIGAPGPVRGPAGAAYVETPVVVYGRLANGAEYHRVGKVTLRRLDEAPDHAVWKIDRIRLEP